LTTKAVVIAALIAPAVPAAASAEPVAYALTETAGFHHDSIPAAEGLLRRLGERSRRYDVRFLRSASQIRPRLLRRAGAVVFLNTSGELPLDAAGKRALLSFVRGGGGLVGTHSASDTFHGWPSYTRLLGGEFESHPITGDARVIVETRRHPATRPLPRTFVTRDEFYFFQANPRRSATVLARLDVPEDRPLVWCRHSGRGRIFYDALGHFPENWSEPEQRSLVRGGLEWALGLESARICR